jgi:hypothetical protein
MSLKMCGPWCDRAIRLQSTPSEPTTPNAEAVASDDAALVPRPLSGRCQSRGMKSDLQLSVIVSVRLDYDRKLTLQARPLE